MATAPPSVKAAGQPLSAAEIAELVGGTAEGPEVTITGVQALDQASPEQASFFGQKPGRQALGAVKKDLSPLLESKAGLVFVNLDLEVGDRSLVRVANPPLAAAMLTTHFHPGPPRGVPGVHPTAVVADDAVLGADVTIGPGCVVGAGARIGDRTVLSARVFVGERTEIGADSYLHPGVTIYHEVQIGAHCSFHAGAVIGADGFGYVWNGQQHYKVPQTGTVIIGNGVEVGANACIDRATFGATTIGDGSIIDNLVQVGHNCTIGRCVVLCGCVGLAGSTVLEDGVVFGGGALSAGHLTVGAGTTVVGASAVIENIDGGKMVGGQPAWELRKQFRLVAAMRRLAEGKKPHERGGSGGK